MTDELRVIQLERQLIETRTAAVRMMLGMAEAIAPTPAGRAALAEGLEAVAETSTGEAARLARLAAKALRGGDGQDNGDLC